MTKISCRQSQVLTAVLLLSFSVKGSTESVFQFSIQPPTSINCNPVNRSILLVCAVIRITGSDPFEVEWMYQNLSGTTETLDYTVHNYSNYLRVAEYNGSEVVENVMEMAGRYWCQVKTGNESTTVKASNALVIDPGVDYSQFEDCKSIIIKELVEQEDGEKVMEADCSVYAEAFVPILTLETIAIILLVVSNIVFVIFWRKGYKTSKDSNDIDWRTVIRRPPPLPVLKEKPDLTISETEYESMLMSVTELRKNKNNDPDYVLPNTFFDSKHRTTSTPNLTSDKEKNKSSTLPVTKEVGGKLYAIADPKTRDTSLYYTRCSTKH